MASQPVGDNVANVPKSEKDEMASVEHKEHAVSIDEPRYEDTELEPDLHWRTWVAVFAVVLINYVAVIALQAPPAVLDYIGASLNATDTQIWIPNAPQVLCAVVGPIISSASDLFQARKNMLLIGCAMGVVGCAIVPGSSGISRVIAGQAIKGFGYATTPLLYAIPSEILPNKWRPMAQAIVNLAAAVASISGPLAIGALVRTDPVRGWRKFWWIEMAMWAAGLVSIFFGYNPPKRRTQYDSLTWVQKLGKLDILGSLLLTVAVTLLLVGLVMGGGQYSWTNARVIATIVVGGVLCVAFGMYEWKGTSTGILHHDLFLPGKPNGRTFILCTGLFAIESILIITFSIFSPILAQALYESDPLKLVARSMPYWVATLLSSPIWAYLSSRYRDIRWPMFAGFFIWTAGTVGLATLQPDTDFSALVFAALSGIGFGAPLIMIVTGVQLSVPHGLIATATSVATSTRALGNAVSTTVYTTIFRARLSSAISARIPPAVVAAGLPISSISGFIQALTSKDPSALTAVAGVTPNIVSIGTATYKQAMADSIRIVPIISAVITVLGTASVLLMDNMKERLNYQIDAPVEEIHAKGMKGSTG